VRLVRRDGAFVKALPLDHFRCPAVQRRLGMSSRQLRRLRRGITVLGFSGEQP
jgi:hypothetical protein